VGATHLAILKANTRNEFEVCGGFGGSHAPEREASNDE
jgi:hypothetical protein